MATTARAETVAPPRSKRRPQLASAAIPGEEDDEDGLDEDDTLEDGETEDEEPQDCG